MKKAISILLGLTIYCSVFAQNQQYPGYSFSAGLISGSGSLIQEAPNGFILGAKIDYQRNFLNWISLRTEMGIIHSFGKDYTTTENFIFYNPNPIYIEKISQMRISGNQYYMSLTPLIYYRELPVHIFFGFYGGFGAANLSWSGTYTFNSSESPQSTQYPQGNRIKYMIGYAPVFGLSYPFGKKSQPSGELELNFQGFGWQNNSDTFPIDEGRFLNSKGIMIHMTYRILLKK